MSEETLFTAARRVVRFIRIDEAAGGITSLDTIKANETLMKMIAVEERKIKERETNSVGKDNGQKRI